MKRTVVIPSISCGHCVGTIERELSELDGVTTVRGSVERREVEIEWEEPASWAAVTDLLDEIGFPPAQ